MLAMTRSICSAMVCVATIYNPEGVGKIANSIADDGPKNVRLQQAVEQVRMSGEPGRFTIPHHYSDKRAPARIAESTS